jgi:translation initiation factor 3 subunit F
MRIAIPSNRAKWTYVICATMLQRFPIFMFSFLFLNKIFFAVDLLLPSSKSPNHTTTAPPDLEIMETSLQSVIDMIDRVLVYVRSVVSGTIEGNERIGKYLLDSLMETSESGAAGIEKGQFENLFNAHLQVRSSFPYHAPLVH